MREPEQIEDEWFRSHYGYAADQAAHWLSPGGNLAGLRLLDFGCGDGITDLGLVLRHGAGRLLGVDLNRPFDHLPKLASENLGLEALPPQLEFIQIEPGQALAGRFEVDAILSWSVFEHVDRAMLPGILADLHALLPAGGRFFLQIEPLYHSPHGSHLAAFLPEPWAHLLMSAEEVERRVQDTTLDDLVNVDRDLAFTLSTFEDFKNFVLGEFRSLNGITADELLDLARAAGFTIEREERGRLEEPEIPAELARYDEDLLRTNEIKALLRRG
jgi:2-polyprenyl-3-methyl-5-hydroxy-6-metoxy-1,4-benzoquinol methylase